jgi:glycosyltransferase involved in cell wall biosynthesis
MSTTPLVSIIVPVPDGEERIGDALRSCTSQSLSDIEIICVDSSGGPGSKVIDDIANADPRVRIVRPPSSTSAPEAHRVGTLAATAPYVLFLQADDEFDRDAAAQIYRIASESNADIAEFGTTVAGTGYQVGGRQTRLQPGHRRLQDEDILRRLFPEDAAVDGSIRRYLFRTQLLRTVYMAVPDGWARDGGDDLPIVFLACAAARTYVSIDTALYRHRPDRGGAHHSAESVAEFRHALNTLDSLIVIEPIVREWARHSPNPEPLVEGYGSARLAIVCSALELLQSLPADLRSQEAPLLHDRASDFDIVAAAATFSPAALSTLAQEGDRGTLGQKPVRSVLLTTNILTTGGVSGVLLAQARVLLDAGCRVTIAAHRPGSSESLVPEGASLVTISGSGKRHRLAQWSELCRRAEIDVVIDHRILYSRDWPGFALAARASGTLTIGWIHNFAGRPTYNGNDLHSLMLHNMNALAQLIVLSPLDVAFWKLRGIRHVAFLPNPPSPLLLGSAGSVPPKVAPSSGRRLEIVWWGRLEEHTKKVTELVEVAGALKRRGADFRLRIIGPDWTDMTAAQLSSLVSQRRLDGFVEVTGARHGQDLLEAIDSSDIFINTSIIEGYLLTIPEAQSRGLPVVMYELPWLLPVQDNRGVISVPQGDSEALAGAISALAADPRRYEELSRASVEAAGRAAAYDFAALYEQLVTGALPAEFSPEPTLEDGQKALNLLIFFGERSGGPKNRAGRRRRPANVGARRGAPRSLGARVERTLTPVGHQVLDIAPWLRPVARKVKRALLRH